MVRVALSVLLLFAATGASARIWHVELDGSGDYTDIQPAVEAAAPGDTISKINTFDGTITKDMGLKPDTTIAVLLTEEELNQFHEDVLAVHFFEYTEPHPPYGEQGLTDLPAPPRTYRTIEMCVQAGAQVKTLRWDGLQPVGTEHQWEWVRLWWLAERMYYHAVVRPEYLALPAADKSTYW